MFKKYYAVILLLLPLSSFAGMYGGLLLGYTSVDNSQTMVTNSFPAPNARTDQFDLSATGGRLKIIGGYEWSIRKRYFVDAESHVELGDSNSINDFTVDAVTVRESFTERTHWGIGLRGGMNFDPSFRGYGLVSYERSRFRDELVQNPGNITLGKIGRWINGVDFGAGMEYYAGNNITWRLEYIHADFGQFGRLFPGFNMHSTPSTNQVNFGFNINYDFGGMKNPKDL